MQTIAIPKGSSGKVRIVYCPEPELKRRLKALVPQLNLIAEALDLRKVCHGFTEGRSTVTNARAHLGWSYTVNFDLADCFDTVSIDLVGRGLVGLKDIPNRDVCLSECFVDGIARQGLPTSPALCNIALSPVDNEIWERFCKSGGRFGEAPCCMTRYADDITISCRTQATVDLLLQEVPKIIERHGFKINPAKTKVQCAKAGRRIITGVAVGESDIYIPRSVKRRVRAGEHQTKNGLKRRLIKRLLFRSHQWKKSRPLRFRFHCQLQGLKEWCKLRSPKTVVELPTQNKAVAAVIRGVKATAHSVVKAFGSMKRKFG